MLILRPEPGASISMDRARAAGFAPVSCPLFAVSPLEWDAPDLARFDALMLTSANAARHAGAALARYAALPLWCVGEKSARTAMRAGLDTARIAGPDSAALIAAMAQAGHRHILHLCGRDVAGVPDPRITRIPVYVSAPTAADPAALIAPGTIILVHSPRAGERLAALVPEHARFQAHVIAISPAALACAGTRWASAQAAPTPDDAAMLALARQLCHDGAVPQSSEPR